MSRPIAVAALILGLASDAGAGPAALDPDLDATRETLAGDLIEATDEAARAAVRDRARAAILLSLDRAIWPAWIGTPWGMGRGSAPRRPGDPNATVGCSAFVAAVLHNLGFRLGSHRWFVEARALEIQRALTPLDRDVHRFREVDADRLAAGIARLGDGVYLIGLRRHIGFVRVKGSAVDLIHAGRDGDAQVRRERLETAQVVIATRPTGYWVTPVLTDAVIDRWLLGRPVAGLAREKNFR